MKRRVYEGRERAGDGDAAPQKRFFRMRAHINPLSVTVRYAYPVAPDRMDWTQYYPQHALVNADGTPRRVEVADIGCGFGGLIMGLAPLLFPRLVLGMEIRPAVSEYVRLRILNARKLERSDADADSAEALQTRPYDNASVLLTNAMKLLPFFICARSLSHAFFCFPDPHFKAKNHRRRIISMQLLDEYVHALREGGRIYTITDVLDLHNWMRAHCDTHPHLRACTASEVDADPVVSIMRTYTEEGKKVERLKGDKYVAVFQKTSMREAAARAAELSRPQLGHAQGHDTEPASDSVRVHGHAHTHVHEVPEYDFWHTPEVDYSHIRVMKQPSSRAPESIRRLAAAEAQAAAIAASHTQ